MQLIFSKLSTIDIPETALMGKVWGVFCEFESMIIVTTLDTLNFINEFLFHLLEIKGAQTWHVEIN